MDNKLTVTIATGIFPPDIGGPATFADHVARTWRDEGHTVRVVIFTPFKRYPKVMRHLAYSVSLFRESRASACMLALDPVSVGVPTAIVAFVHRMPFVLRMVGDYAWEQYTQSHGFMSLEDFQQADIPFFYRLLRTCERVVARRARMVIVPSAYLAGIVGMWGVPERRIHVVYNTVTPAHTPKTEYSAGSPFRLIAVGRLVPWKGFAMLIHALKNIPNVTLDIVGSGPDSAHLGEVIAQEGLTSRVTMHSGWSRDTLRDALPNYDAFVLPTQYEGFSHALIEAMSAGLPIVTTHAGGNRELITHEKNALVADPFVQDEWTRSIARLVEDASLRASLGTAAAKDAHAYEGITMAQSYMTHLQSL